MKTKANDEWLLSMETTDGIRQFIQGLTVDKVICDFPLIDVERAVAEVKRDKPEDKILQHCKVPKMAYVLKGIKYKIIHPEAIHSTFDCLCEQAGGVPDMVANFARGINKYRDEDWYAPRVP
jgi:hypothetical protein